MMAHTKGKWSYRPGQYNSIEQSVDTHPGSIAADDGEYTWYVAAVEYLRDEDEANGYVLAASSDLLEACEEALKVIELYSPYSTAYDLLEAAIAKAKGQ